MFVIKKKFCPSCGKETENLIRGVCKKCFKKRNSIAEIPEKIEVKVCKKCGNVKVQNKWKNTSFEKVLKSQIKNSVKFKEWVTQGNIKFEGFHKGPFEIDIRVRGNINGEKIKQSQKIKIEVSEGTCTKCSKRKSGYFEAILQIRGNDKEKVKEALEIAKDVLRQSGGKKDYISDFQEVKNGVDLLTGSKSLAKKVARKISSKFDTERKGSKSLSGLDEGKKTYKSTYLVRILD